MESVLVLTSLSSLPDWHNTQKYLEPAMLVYLPKKRAPGFRSKSTKSLTVGRELKLGK